MESQEIKRIHVNCDLCGADNPVPHFEVEGNTFVECGECGFIYINPRPTEGFEEVSEASVEGLTEKGFRESRAWYYRRILREFKPYRKTGKLLEVGCASGGFLKAAKDEGWEAVGIEISDELAALGRGLGLDIRTCDICKPGLPNEQFDVIAMNMVIEHLPSPTTAVRVSLGLLRPGGALWLHTPNYASTAIRMSRDGYTYPSAHPSCFTPATLRKLCADAGFEIKYLKTTGFRFPGKRKTWRKPFEKTASLFLGRLGKGHRMRLLAVKPD